VASYSCCGPHLLSFSPIKPTGEFHLKIYLLCHAVTNLTLQICIHAKDGADDDAGIILNEVAEISKTDQLTLSMCDLLFNSGASVNMDNYNMPTICAAHLCSKGVYCRGT
jgi:hypothetical protein